MRTALLLALACSSAPHPGEAPVAWKDMSKAQRARYMADVVVPRMKPLFQRFAPEDFGDFDCATCHGAGAKNRTFAMPNPDIFVLPSDVTPADFAGFKQLFADKPAWMHFMSKQVLPAMLELLQQPEYSSDHRERGGFGCFSCHTHERL